MIFIVAIIWIVISLAPGSESSEISSYHPFRSEKAREQYLKQYALREKKWPVVSETLTVNTSFGQTFARISGPNDAPPLVLLHGVSGNSLQWGFMVKALSDSFRVYAVDNIYDCGRSVYTRIINDADDYVQWLDELFSALELGDSINLMGLSFGGWLTSQYALSHSDRLNKIVLLAPAGTVLPLRGEWILRAILCMLPHRYFVKNFTYWLVEDFVQESEANRKIADEWVDDTYLAIRCFKQKRMVNPAVLTDAQLKNITVPTLFLVGENEKIYSPEEAVQRLDSVAPQINVEVIPDAGHDLAFVQAELVNKIVLEFLKQP